MKNNRNILILAVLVMILAAVASAGGLFAQGSGESFTFTTLRGEEVFMYGHGLYRYDSLSGATQEIAQDAVTLFIGIPLMLAGVLLSRKGLLRGRLLLTGAFAYFLYTYASMTFLTAYNHFFLVYVALFSLSLFGFILSLSGIDPTVVAGHVTEKFPRKVISIFAFILGGFLIMVWGGLIMPSVLGDAIPSGLESYTTLVIQALDLGVVVPSFILAGVLLWQKRPWGYTLAAVLMLKGLMMGLALIAMVINQVLAGVAIDPVTSSLFVIICLAGLAINIWMMRAIRD